MPYTNTTPTTVQTAAAATTILATAAATTLLATAAAAPAAATSHHKVDHHQMVLFIFVILEMGTTAAAATRNKQTNTSTVLHPGDNLSPDLSHPGDNLSPPPPDFFSTRGRVQTQSDRVHGKVIDDIFSKAAIPIGEHFFFPMFFFPSHALFVALLLQLPHFCISDPGTPAVKELPTLKLGKIWPRLRSAT